MAATTRVSGSATRSGTFPFPLIGTPTLPEEILLFNNGVSYFDFDTRHTRGVYLGSFQNPLPAPLDLDGDGDMELTVFANGLWYFYRRRCLPGRRCYGECRRLPISRRLLP